MPIFEYICQCGHSFDKLMRSDALVECPACRSREVVKKISLFAVQNAHKSASPECASECGGFESGSCGSGMCGCHGHD